MATINELVAQAEIILADAEKALGYELTNQLYDLLADNTEWDARTLAVVVNVIRTKRG